MNQLSLEWRLSRIETLPDLCWLEYVVDGVSLAELLSIPAQQTLSIELPLDKIGALGAPADQVVEQMQRGFTDQCHVDHLEMFLMARPAEVLHSGRTPFYLCPACLDVNCGAISAYIKRLDQTIQWSEFRYEVNYGWKEKGQWVWGVYDYAAEWSGIGPFTFDYAQYEQCLRNPPPLPEEILRQLRT